ncbi:MAG: hypothetical protein CMJ46_01525 [Planctomyces sp.]|nr:hypothetical protein [Planctomyces sp.]
MPPVDIPDRIECPVAGPYFHQTNLEKVQGETRALLCREPYNEHDPNAIVVHVDGKKIGYVPAVEARWMAPILDAGVWTYECTYLSISRSGERNLLVAEMVLERRPVSGPKQGAPGKPATTERAVVQHGAKVGCFSTILLLACVVMISVLLGI